MGRIIDELKERTTPIKVQNYLENVEDFHEINPFFYDKTGTFWLWNQEELKYEKVDDIDIMNLIEKHLSFRGETVTAGIKNSYLEAFKRVGRKHIPKIPPKEWIQFRGIIYDLEKETTLKATPYYFFCNPIPWPLGTKEETPVIDKLFNDWVGTRKEQLYEVLAYCLYQRYPINIIIALVGAGRNGKTRFLKILKRFLGEDNIISTEMDILIDSRFESAKLYKKLACIMGETNFSVISKTSLIKKITGEDLIGGEFKNKSPFDFENYAKIIIASNGLPISSDTTDGWFRRWHIIIFDNEFPEGQDVVETIPRQEYSNLALKCVKILKELLKKGHFSFQGSVEERKNNYIKASNPLNLFLQEYCDFGEELFCKSKDLFFAYEQYLKGNKRRGIKRKEFNILLAEEGFFSEHIDKKIGDGWLKSYWIEGLQLRNSPNLPNSPMFLTQFHIYENHMENIGEMGKKGEIVLKIDVTKTSDPIQLPCSSCGAPPPCRYEDKQGRPLCDFCATESDIKDLGGIKKWRN